MLSTAGGGGGGAGEEDSFNYSTATAQGRDRSLIPSSSSSPSKSSSSAASVSPSPSPTPTPFSLHHPTTITATATTMEEVWNDISLASLHDRIPSRSDDPAGISHFRSFTFQFQDFLSRPLGKSPPPPPPPPPIHPLGFGAPASPPLATALSLNSGPDQFGLLLRGSDPTLQARPASNMSFEALASSSPGLMPKRRFPESDGSTSNDRRHKRMIKNRESAARSRARKQAYTNELEIEVAHLLEENARLKREQEQLCLAAAAAQVPRRSTLHRSSTAPF